jgi:hypothetical protein
LKEKGKGENKSILTKAPLLNIYERKEKTGT